MINWFGGCPVATSLHTASFTDNSAALETLRTMISDLGIFIPCHLKCHFRNIHHNSLSLDKKMGHCDIHSSTHGFRACVTGLAVGCLRLWRGSGMSNTEWGRQEIAAERALCLPLRLLATRRDDIRTRGLLVACVANIKRLTLLEVYSLSHYHQETFHSEVETTLYLRIKYSRICCKAYHTSRICHSCKCAWQLSAAAAPQNYQMSFRATWTYYFHFLLMK